MAVAVMTGAREVITVVDPRSIGEHSAADIAAYRTAFDSLQPLREERVRLIEIMNGAGPTAERMAIILMKGVDQVGNTPATYQAAVVLSNLMVAQLYATRFLVENDQEQVELVLDELSSLQANLRSEEHTSELHSLMRTPYAVLCLERKMT